MQNTGTWKSSFLMKSGALKGENSVYVIYEGSLSGPHKYVGDFLSFVFIFAAAPQRRYTGLFVLPQKGGQMWFLVGKCSAHLLF